MGDYGGDSKGRAFPLLFYVALPTHALPGPTSGTLCAIWSILGKLGQLHQEMGLLIEASGNVESLLTPQAIDLARLAESTEDATWSQAAGQLLLSDWFAGVSEQLTITDEAEWFRAAHRWGGTIASLEGDTFEATLRFPISTAGSAQIQGAGWLRWLESRMNLGRRRLSLVVSADPPHRAGHLVVVARPLVSEDFFLATPACESLAYVDDLARVAPSSGSDADPPPTPLSESSTWLDFVESPVDNP